MEPRDIEDLEISLFLEALRLRHGHDYRHHARASLTRRLRRLRDREGVPALAHLLPRLLHDEAFLTEVVDAISITVTEMFRDPPFFQVLRREVIPYLKTYPFVKIWHAGCATGEEAYSLAILLREEGFLERATIYATDCNPRALDRARAGIYPLSAMREHAAAYQRAGGSGSLMDHCHAGQDNAIMDPALKRAVTFGLHNLATDGVFGEMHCILCRNVLIYFDEFLQRRVLGLFDDSLIHGGILALGGRESLRLGPFREQYDTVDAPWRVYRKRGAA